MNLWQAMLKNNSPEGLKSIRGRVNGSHPKTSNLQWAKEMLIFSLLMDGRVGRMKASDYELLDSLVGRVPTASRSSNRQHWAPTIKRAQEFREWLKESGITITVTKPE